MKGGNCLAHAPGEGLIHSATDQSFKKSVLPLPCQHLGWRNTPLPFVWCNKERTYTAHAWPLTPGPGVGLDDPCWPFPTQDIHDSMTPAGFLWVFHSVYWEIHQPWRILSYWECPVPVPENEGLGLIYGQYHHCPYMKSVLSSSTASCIGNHWSAKPQGLHI